MPLDRSSANSQENGTPGRLKLVLRLDNKGKAADAKETPAPATSSSDSRPKRSPHPTKTLSEESFYHGQKIPKKPGVVAEDPSTKEKEDDFRPSRKRKSTMDSDFVFDPIYSKKEGEEEEGEEDVVDTKKHHKKRSHRHGKDTDEWNIATPPLQEETTSFKLKLKLPKPPPPDTPDQSNKSRKVETPSSGDSKRRRRHEYEDEDEEVTPPRLRVTLKKPVDKKETTPPQTRKAKADSAGGSTKKHSPPKKEEFVPEKRELREKPKPTLEPKVPLSEEDSVKMKKHLANILGQLIKLDKQMYFTEPVTEDIAPQYFSIIHHPMDFKTMKKKLKDGKYNSLESLQDDFQLICNNCMTYNPASTSYAKEAKRMLNLGNRLLEKFQDVPLGTTTEHKFDDRKKETDKTPTRQSSFSSTPNKATPNKPATNTTPSHPLTRSATAPSTPSTPLNNSLGVAFPISSGQLSSMQHPISTTPQHAPYPLTPTGLRKPGMPPSAYPPPLNPNLPYSPRIGAHIPGSPAIPSTITRPPPLLPLQKSQSTNSMLPRTPLTPSMPSTPTPALGQRPPAPVGKPGSRPPVVSMTENQAAQTQAMFPEQPKRKYVKLPVEEPVKPPPPAPPVKTPAKLVAKIGTTPLVSPANVPGSFVYSMYIPRFESAQKSSPTETPNSPPSTPLAPKNYINNYVSVPSLYLPLPPPDSSLSTDEWRAPSKHTVVENNEVMEAIASDSLISMDTNSRSQLLKFFEGIATNGLNNSNSLSFPSFATSTLLPRSSLHVPLQQPIRPIHKQPLLAPTPTAPPSSSSTPVHATTIPPTLTTHHSPSPTLPTPPSFLIMDSELSEQLDKLETHNITAQDLQQLQGFQIDLSFLSTLIASSSSSSSSPVSPQTVTSSISTSNTTTTTTTTTTTSPPLAEPMDITPLSSIQISTPPTSPPTSPPVSSARTPVVVQPNPVKAKKLAQEILDKNLEHLWALQLLQHERIASNPSETEIRLASQFLDGVFALGTAVPPSMLTSKEAIRAAMDTSGLVTGKRRNMRV